MVRKRVKAVFNMNCIKVKVKDVFIPIPNGEDSTALVV